MCTISFFLVCGIAIMVLLLIAFAFAERNFINEPKNKFREVYFGCFVGLSVIAVFTVRNYIYPTGDMVFKNTDYHIIEHKGFRADSVFYLVRANYPEDYFPEMSLWDGKSGLVKLTPDTIYIADYCEPFFVEKKKTSYRKADSLSNHEGNEFVLANKIIPSDIGKEGLLITRERGGRKDTLYRLTLVEHDQRVLYISSSSQSRPDTSRFTRRINRGYPISDIIAQSPHFDFNEELQDLFEGALLVHERIPIFSNNGRESDARNDSPLLLSPGPTLYASDDILINGSIIDGGRFATHYSGDTFFFSGIGRSKTDTYNLSYDPETRTLDIRYILPKMRKLKAEGGRLFITSSVDAILDDSKDGGYYYNLFDNDNNFNHINGEIRYVSGTARDNMLFEIMDVYSQNPSEKIRIAANNGKEINEFQLSVRAKSMDKTKWIFDVKDLRESNPLQFRDIVLFILAFVFLVGLRLLTDTFVSPRSLTIIELSAYVVVFCLCVVRLILGWRSSTFVPIEDVTAPVFSKMRNSILSTTCYVCLLPIAMICLSSFPTFKNWLLTLCQKIRQAVACRYRSLINSIKRLLAKSLPGKVSTFVKKAWGSAPNKDIVFLFFLALCACALACGGKLERLMNIPVPIVTYLLFDIWLIRREKHSDTTTARLFIAVLTFGYLFYKDAGFTVVFFVFLFLYHAVIGTIINGNLRRWSKNSFIRNFLVWSLIITCGCLLFFFLNFEGDIMIWAFGHVGWILLGGGTLMVILFFVNRAAKKNGQNRLMVGIVYAVAAMVLLSAGLYELTPGSAHLISEKINSKVHMKYRAEVQKLREDQKIDDLIEKYDFKSTDITYIMRSAHNQWFINQYLRAGESLNPGSPFRKGERYFILQPHSNQGSTYTTQTTDLVITRYVIAEHGKIVVLMFMTLFFLLICVYACEANLKNSEERAMMGPILLLFVIALMVFLSATNRVVFVGQDFPFISLQSKVAILFPLALLFLSISSVTSERLRGLPATEPEWISKRKWAIVAGMLVFSIFCVLGISQQGKNQNERQFDVSEIIQSLSGKIELLDKSLMKYQLAKGTNTLSKDSLWRAFSKDEQYAVSLQKILLDESDTNRFYRSLIEYFDSRQAVKNNPEELLHLRKRSGIWHLALNKKHFFIPSMLEESLQWHGNLLSAQTKRYFSFKTTHSGNERRISSADNFDKNILPQSIQSQVENVQISRFDSSWTDSGEPLLLINSYMSLGSPQFFHIEAAEGTIKGSGSSHQLATRIKDGDLVMINKLDHGEEKEVLGWKYGRDNENFLAKNIWMNGKQRLFYPLGKESMWSYQFANAVSSSLGKSDTYRDSTLRVSIDYDLHKEFYRILSSRNQTKLALKVSTVQQLQEFEELPFSEMQNIHNVSSFYYVPGEKKLKYKKRITNEIDRVVSRINELLAKADPDMDREAQITGAIDQVVKRKFDFSAVVLDGNGRIRLLFDHTRSRNIDPNNIRYFNKFMSDMYKNGDNQSERDVFGNKALQILPSGPGSSFKPIAYTSITSRQKLAWEQLDVLTDYKDAARSAPNPKSKSSNVMYDYYGGIDCAKLGQPLSIDGNNGLKHNNYLIYSNNLYHSAVIMLGIQPHGKVEEVFKSAGNGKFAFPVMIYKGERKSFDPDVWFPLHPENGIMNDGLLYNFHLSGDIVSPDDRYSNFFGESPVFELIFKNAPDYKVWTYPETGSHNIFDRKLSPQIRNGFNQMLLGAYPLEVSPLQMAIMGMRLATLNRTASMTTLDDSQEKAPDYEFFNIDSSWRTGEFHKFYQRQVLSQLRKVPLEGTATALKGLSVDLSKKGYYLYAKTGTLNDGRINASRDSRMKHLMVIIANKPLETVASIEDLRKVKYYVLYLSYIGVNSEGFSNSHFQEMISAVVNSELFKEYMGE